MEISIDILVVVCFNTFPSVIVDVSTYIPEILVLKVSLDISYIVWGLLPVT